MRKFLIFLLLLTPVSSFAAVNTHIDWYRESGSEKRELNVCFHRGMNSQWRDWASAAVNKWNERAEATGWTFDIVAFTKSRCDIFMVLQDMNERIYQGVRVDWFDVVQGDNEALDGRINVAVINIDSYLEETVEWLSSKEDVSDGYRDGWSTASEEGTMDPVDAIMHGIARSIRIESMDDYERDVVSDDIVNPRLPGQHLQQLSTDDIREASNAASEDFEIALLSVNSAAQEDAELGGLKLTYPRSTFSRRGTLTTTPLAGMTPVPLSVPLGYSHVFDAFGLYTAETIRQPIEVTLSYSDDHFTAAEKGLEGASGYYAPGLAEYSLTVVKLQKETWDLTPAEISDNPSQWVVVENATVDRDNNTVTFTVTEPGFYGLTAKADPAKPAVETTYVRVYDDKVVPSSRFYWLRIQKYTEEMFGDPLVVYSLGILTGLTAFLLYNVVRNYKRNRLPIDSEKNESASQ